MACKHFDNFQMLLYLFCSGFFFFVLFYWIGKELFDSLKMVKFKRKKKVLNNINYIRIIRVF
jgi:hypothetical protein